MPSDELLQLPPPPALPRRTGSELLAGAAISPERRLKIMPSEELESLVLHWLDETRRPRYTRLLRAGGTGDMGRDVIGYLTADPAGAWDNYQCKHYATPLVASHILTELGKLVYYSSQGAYCVPDNYFFVAPKGVSEKTRLWLADPEQVRTRLIDGWKKYCAKLCPLTEIRDQLTGFAFPPLDVIKGEDIILSFKGKPSYAAFFGGGLAKPRPEVKTPPDEVEQTELGYIGCLVEAYEEHSSGAVSDRAGADSHATYGPHLRGSRRDFYCAESLREFSKDVLVAENEQYAELQQQLLDGIEPVVQSAFATGYDRVLGVTAHATTVELSDHPLAPEVRPSDRKGICHQLANDGRVRWSSG
ncbi:ABC-three component system protein [Baekduia sp. Peel2402]|uniref:ABC-three component system protein n=1 Tax=Baekduia sp. Peel2402 TaxID=3458296 RepID=UPI00403EA498